MKDKDLLDKIIALTEDIVKLKMENIKLKEELKHDNALITRDIEIPFGAKDSELQEASYHIPEGFHAKIEGDKVVMKQGAQILANSCKTCKGEQKHAWSEEDEEHYNACLNYFEEIKPDSVFYKDYLWLKSLKERIERR